MGGRWLFILLCAILVQLGGSEDGVDEDGIRLTTISPDWTTEDHWHGGEKGDGSEFTSGKKKIRRARSTTPEDELAAAKAAFEVSRTAKEKAKKDFADAKEYLENVTNELHKAEENLTKIDGFITNALEMKRKAEIALKNFTEIDKKNAETNTSAYNDFKTQNAELWRLGNDTLRLDADYTLKLGAFKKAETDYDEAVTKNATTKSAWDDAKSDLQDLQDDLTRKSGSLTKQIEKENKNKEKIKLYLDYELIKSEKGKPENDKTPITAILPGERKKVTNLENDMSIFVANRIVKGRELGTTWTVTVDKAIEESKTKLKKYNKELEELKTKNAAANKITGKNGEILYEDGTLKGLQELKSLGYGTTQVQELLDNYAYFLSERQKAIDAQKQIVKGKEDELDVIDKRIAAIEGRLSNLANGKSFNTIKNEWKDAKQKEKTYRTNVIEAENAKASAEQKIEQKAPTVPGLEQAYINARDALPAIEQTFNSKKTAKETAEDLWTQAKNAESTHKEGKWKKAKETLEEADKEKLKSAKLEKNARLDITGAEKAMEERTQEKDEATKLVKSKKEEQVKATKAKDAASDKDHIALNNFSSAVETVGEKEKALAAAVVQRKKDKDEAEARSKTLTALGTGLGITIAIIVLMVVGGVVFVLIRKKKKKAAEAAAAAEKAKTPKITYRDDPNTGLTILSKEGEEDRWVVLGKDIQIRGPLIHRRVHNNEVPLKHALDGQEGGDKIEKIFFAKELNEGFYIGEGVEIIEPDSVSVSEGKGAAKEEDLPINFGEDDDKYKKEETNSKKAVAAAPGVEDKKPTGSKKSSKSKRDANANAPVPKIPPPPPPPANALVKPPPAPPSSSSADEKKKK